MRIAILTAGTEGDVRPLLALGAGLAAAGHDVVLATDPGARAMADSAGIGFAPLDVDVRRIVDELRAEIGGGRLALLRRAIARLSERAPLWAEAGLAATDGAGLVLGSGGATWLAASLAERRGVPFVRLNLQPLEPNRAFGPLLLEPTRIPLPGAVRLALHHAARTATWLAGRPAIGTVRAHLGLPPYPRLGPWSGGSRARPTVHGTPPVLNGFDPDLVPGQGSLEPRVRTVGAWARPVAAGFAPPDALARFLEAGPPPVYVGFGSMSDADPAALASTVVAALRARGLRAVVSGGWGGFADGIAPGEDVLAIGPVPHDWLFARVSIAIHHCGAGTAAAAARAGIASVPVPFLLDQFFWAARLHAAGIAARPVPHARLSARRLARAVDAALEPGMRARADRFGRSLRATDPVAQALAALRDWGLIPPAAEAPRNPDDGRA